MELQTLRIPAIVLGATSRTIWIILRDSDPTLRDLKGFPCDIALKLIRVRHH